MESLNALLQGMGLMHLGAGQAIMLLDPHGAAAHGE